MQKIILSLLAFFAKSIIDFHKPKIIGITGTVGKTTVTTHVYNYLSQTLKNQKITYSRDHYNGEFGLPLTIIGTKTGGKNPLKWFWVFIVAFSRFFRTYPDYIILEYGIDHPGEMDFLLSIAVPDIAIITEIAPNHIEQFGTFELYKAEKFKIIHQAGELIVHDSLRDCIDREAIYYGTGGMSQIDASHVQIDASGTSSQVHVSHMIYPIHVRAIGIFHIVNLLPLYAIGNILSLPLDAIADYALLSTSEPGRSSILEGIQNSTIIDGSYNGGYLSLHSGIGTMRSLGSSRGLIFLIGDMRELGVETEFLHKQLAEEIIQIFPHKTRDIYFFLVGTYMQDYVFPILREKFSTQSFLSSREAGGAIQKVLAKKHEKPMMVYVKGSQNTIFLEEAIEMLLAHPGDRVRLCRQTSDWKRKKEIFFSSLY